MHATTYLIHLPVDEMVTLDGNRKAHMVKAHQEGV
jgi:hypothetical protein